ncbi:formylmethanofuran dehydrogenase subunit E [Thermosulfidibacter takaii ABI70S6]|uniref:Formylmethanofuran dehydrogenase subunit E n=1 Tax=Thermosulfidibacter takaii (strain DSM 17441 / JCM 13301 / NBRC 103674 / ABI70S6) TaxID=1298851 RepID=A0A0S3QVM0_THET7|nr:FmdE family protein [Thermosulfidibacter takaii]BAT72381.1 formylmethanofuran dehydrogenase subunit E [Thermosulfidibacter takaii ABI70S6]
MVDEKLLELGFAFHGHKCPAMPLGLRAGLKAMEVLGVERSKDKELYVIAETGKGHAAGCFLDGIMVATGCTYGKSNIEKKYWDKMAFTLVDTKTNRAVRVSLKPEFFAKALQSPFVERRKQGIPPQDIPFEVLKPLLDRILSMPYEDFLDVSEIFEYKIEKKPGCFTAVPCAICGELTFEKALRVKDGKLVCIPCSGYEK